MKDSSKHYIKYIEIAKYRLLLDMDMVDNIIDEVGIIDNCYRPIKKPPKRKYLEYILSLDIKVKKGQYADFIRAISPIIGDIFEKIVEQQIGINIKYDLCIDIKTANNDSNFRWNKTKLTNPKSKDKTKRENINKINKILKKNDNFKYGGFVYSSQLETIISEMVEDDNIKKIAKELRFVEQSVRNITAHKIVSVNEDFIKDKTITIDKPEGYTCNDIIKCIKTALNKVKITLDEQYYNSYEKMNEDIKSKMK